MTAPAGGQQAQDQLEQIVNRIAQRAADNVARPVADLGRQLALAQESLDNLVAAHMEQKKQLEEKDAELARAHQVAEQLRARIAELEAPAAEPVEVVEPASGPEGEKPAPAKPRGSAKPPTAQ